MSSNTWSYEVFVPEVSHVDPHTKEKIVDRGAVLIATGVGVYPKPTRGELLKKYADKLQAAGIDFGNVEEVYVNIGPFLP